MKGRLIDAYDHLVYFWPAEAYEAIRWALRRNKDEDPEVVYLPRGRRRRR